MKTHIDLPCGWSLHVMRSYGTKRFYVTRNPYRDRGLMVGFNGPLGHFVSLEKETSELHDDRDIISI